jgi:hypothetical protein
MVSMVEYMLSKPKALSSNISTTKKKKLIKIAAQTL